MGLTLITPPAADPVSLAEAKAQVRVQASNTDEDTLITRLISAATRHIERSLDLSLMERTYRLTLDAFTDAIELPRGPVSAVNSVKYFDAEGVEQTVSDDDYTTDLTSIRNWVVLNSGSSWPATLNAVNAVSVEYVAGFDTLPTEYDDLRHAILLLIGHWYLAREAVSADAMKEVPLAVDALMQAYRTVYV